MITPRREINLRWITLFLYEWKLFSPLNFPSQRKFSARLCELVYLCGTFNISNTCLPESHVFSQFPRNASLITSRRKEIFPSSGLLLPRAMLLLLLLQRERERGKIVRRDVENCR